MVKKYIYVQNLIKTMVKLYVQNLIKKNGENIRTKPYKKQW